MTCVFEEHYMHLNVDQCISFDMGLYLNVKIFEAMQNVCSCLRLHIYIIFFENVLILREMYSGNVYNFKMNYNSTVV